MSKGFAHVTLAGNLVSDPEVRSAGDKPVCNFSVAVNTTYKSGNEWKEKVSYFDVVVWGSQGEACARNLRKGSSVTINGRLDQRSWETQEGSKRSKVEIVADTVVFGSAPQAVERPNDVDFG